MAGCVIRLNTKESRVFHLILGTGRVGMCDWELGLSWSAGLDIRKMFMLSAIDADVIMMVTWYASPPFWWWWALSQKFIAGDRIFT